MKLLNSNSFVKSVNGLDVLFYKTKSFDNEAYYWRAKYNFAGFIRYSEKTLNLKDLMDSVEYQIRVLIQDSPHYALQA